MAVDRLDYSPSLLRAGHLRVAQHLQCHLRLRRACRPRLLELRDEHRQAATMDSVCPGHRPRPAEYREEVL